MSSHKETVPYDLRSAIELLKKRDGEFVSTDTEVDPHAELFGVYRYVEAGEDLRTSDP